jgi:hypothetical protein
VRRAVAHLILTGLRQHHKLILYYKIANNLVPTYLTQRLPNTVADSTPYPLRNNNNRRQNIYRLTICKSSFLPSATELWNNLQITARTLPTISRFKKFLRNSTPKPPYYNKKCTGLKGNLITRMRLGLSALNSHRYTYNLIDNPICTLCNREPETSSHYFIRCPSHRAPRMKLMARLHWELRLTAASEAELMDILLRGIIPNRQQTLLIEVIAEFMTATTRFN